jgi:hypothetical protein
MTAKKRLLFCDRARRLFLQKPDARTHYSAELRGWPRDF